MNTEVGIKIHDTLLLGVQADREAWELIKDGVLYEILDQLDLVHFSVNLAMSFYE